MPSDFSRIIRESLPVLLLCVVGGIAAGLILESLVDEFSRIPGLIIIIPALLGMRGNISGVLSSRLTSALHLGLIEPELKWREPLKGNIYAALFLNIVLSLILGITAHFTNVAVGDGETANFLQLTLITLLAGTSAGAILSFLAVGIAVYTYSSGYDPDNVVSPLLSTVGDLITVLCLLFVTKIIV